MAQRTHTPLPVATIACLALAFGVAAQGHLHWPDTSETTPGMVVQVGPAEYAAYFSGWTMRAAATGLDGGGDAGAGLGHPNASLITSVSSADLIAEETGENAEDNTLFPFTPNIVTAMGFFGLQPNLNWSGFHASVSSPVPDFERGVLAFRIQSFVNMQTLLGELAQSVVGVSETTSGGMLLTTPSQNVIGVGPVVAARIAHLKFERGNGAHAINYGGFGGAPRLCPITTNGIGWAPGLARSDASLRGGGNGNRTFCDTGWRGPLCGSFSVAWHMRQRTAPTGVSHLFTGPGGFRCFTGGAAGTGLRCEGWGGAPLTLAMDIQGAAAAGPVHVALVVQGGTRAVWYVDNAPQPGTPLGNSASIAEGASLRVGAGLTPTDGSTYDIDEFWLVADAVGASTVRTWSAGSPPGATSFGTTCGCNMRHVGGAPAVGNPGYRLRVEGPPSSLYVMIFGVGTQFGPVPLPVDLGLFFPNLSGCQLYSDLSITAAGFTDAAGLAHVSVPLTPRSSGVELYNQAVIVAPNGTLLACNAHATSIE